MKISLPTYRKNTLYEREPVIHPEHWEKAQKYFEDKAYLKSVIEVLRYINSEAVAGEISPEGFHIFRSQGSAVLELKADTERFYAKVPFLKITGQTNRTALLRTVAEKNFEILTLTQIKLKGDELYFEYEVPLDLALPDKLYLALREIALSADRYDDLFINRFGAEFLNTPERGELKPGEQEQVRDNLALIFNEYDRYIERFRAERKEDFFWDILMVSFLKISIMSVVHGQLRTDLYEIIAVMFNTQLNFKTRIDKGMHFMEKLKSKFPEEIVRDLYHAEYFISMQMRSDRSIVSEVLAKYENTVESYLKKDKTLDLAFMLEVIFLRLMYDYNLEPACKEKIENALIDVSGKEAGVAANKLYALYGELRDVNEEKDGKTKGFFSKLFGLK